MAKYCVQKATDYESQSAKWKARNPSIDALAATHLGLRKYDGCHLVVRSSSDGHGEAFSRTEEHSLSCDHIVHAIQRVYGLGWVVFGEVWQEGVPFPEISGAYRRQAPQPQLKFVPFDIVPAGSYAIGIHDVPFSTRFRHLYNTLGRDNFPGSPLIPIEYFKPGTYQPQALANKLVAAGGSDGLIMRDLTAHWVKDVAKEGELIKVKPVLSLDLRVVGVEEGKGKMVGMAGALLVTYKGKVSKAGGLDYDTRRAWLAQPEKIIGQIVEVECLGITEDGFLREPRIKAVRYDKITAD
jgi:DNA ligase-1